MSYRVIQGDCIDGMKTLPDQSVQMCVTSPPYFGLRDYGTASWDGGDPICQHRVGNQVQDSKAPGAIQSGMRPGADASTCKLCGAKRIDQQIGLEATPDAFVAKLVEVFREVKRVLRDDGTVWLNLGDSYAGYHGNKNEEVPTSATNGWTNGTNENARTSTANRNGLKQKDLIGIPWRVAFALQADGWYLRQDIIWHKPNPMPESVTDRCTKAHEYIFMLTKSARYWYDAKAIKEPSTWIAPKPDGNASTLTGQKRHRANPEFNICLPEEQRRPDLSGRSDKQRGHGRRHAGFNERWSGMTKEEQGAMGRNKRSVWTVATRPYAGAHFATFPPELIRPCILAGCPVGGTVIDPFGGSGTTAEVAVEEGREAILCELNPDYISLIHQRMSGLQYRIPA